MASIMLIVQNPCICTKYIENGMRSTNESLCKLNLTIIFTAMHVSKFISHNASLLSNDYVKSYIKTEILHGQREISLLSNSQKL